MQRRVGWWVGVLAAALAAFVAGAMACTADWGHRGPTAAGERRFAAEADFTLP